MKLSMPINKQLWLPSRGRPGLELFSPWRHQEKIVVVMGATGTGKSRLSIDIATRFPAEIVNSDKIQVYEGLDIVTNKVSEHEKCGIPHHLLGIIDPNADFTSTDFCNLASIFVNSITGRGRIPIIVGGSNSYIETFVDNNEDTKFCFLWVDVEMPVLQEFVSVRVDRMVENGMVDEVRKLFNPNVDYSKGIRKAIGVPEFDKYFRFEKFSNKKTREKLLREAINVVKENTIKLAYCQLKKIHRLKNVKRWKIHRLDATEVFRRQENEADYAWNELVAGPSNLIVSQFLNNNVSVDFSSTTRVGANSLAAASH